MTTPGPTGRDALMRASPEEKGLFGSGLAADLVNDVVGVRDDVEVAVRPLLDVGVMPKPLPIRRVSLSVPSNFCDGRVVGDAVGEARVGADVDVQPVGCESEAVQAAAVVADLLEAAGRADPERAVILRPERVALTKVVPAGPISYLQLNSGSM